MLAAVLIRPQPEIRRRRDNEIHAVVVEWQVEGVAVDDPRGAESGHVVTFSVW